LIEISFIYRRNKLDQWKKTQFCVCLEILKKRNIKKKERKIQQFKYFAI
jgi:hypothetical protein